MESNLSTITEIFNARKTFYKKSKATDNIGHIFTSMISNKNSYNDIGEKVLLYMIFQTFQSALFKLKTRNFSYAEYFIKKSESLMNKLESTNAKIAIQGISLPLYSFKYYIKKDYEKAKEELKKSFPVFEKLFDLEVEDAIWVKREQYLNLIRIYMNQRKYDGAFNFTERVISSFLGSEITKDGILNEKEKAYLSSLSDFKRYDGMNGLIDSILFKINVIDETKQKKKLYNSAFKAIKKADGYNYLNKTIESYLTNDRNLINDFISVCHTEYVLPRSVEGLLLKKASSNVMDQEVESLIKDYSSEVLNITFIK